MNITEICISKQEAAKMLGVTPKDLDIWREASCGPAYYLLPPITEKGRPKVIYSIDDLKEWIFKYKIITERPEVAGARKFWRLRRNARHMLREQKQIN